MPVDLSKIGLEGIESYYAQQESQARTRSLNSSSAKQDFEVEQAQRMQALADKASQYLNDTANRKRGGGTELEGDGESLAEPLEAIADLYMRGGAPTQGAEFLSKASEIRKRESDIDNDAVLSSQRRLENILKGSDIVGRKLGGARNQAEWDQGLREVESAGVIEPHLMEQLKSFKDYSPDVAAYFREQAISAADKASMDLTAQGQEATERYRSSLLTNTRRTQEMQAARDAETRRHNRVMERNGGDKAPSASAPTEQEVKIAKRALKVSVFKGLEIDESDPSFGSAADYIASRAKSILKDNKAISYDVAIQQAIILGQEDGTLGVTPKSGGFLGFGEDPARPKFDPYNGKTPDSAMAMPASKDKMVKGRYYITSKGRAKWNGTAFELVE